MWSYYPLPDFLEHSQLRRIRKFALQMGSILLPPLPSLSNIYTRPIQCNPYIMWHDTSILNLCQYWTWVNYISPYYQYSTSLWIDQLLHVSVYNFKLPLSLTRDITSDSMENLVFHSLLRWGVILPILTTSLIHFYLRSWENALFEPESERVIKANAQ